MTMRIESFTNYRIMLLPVFFAFCICSAMPCRQASAQAPEAAGGSNPYSNLEPSDDYKPDGYYEPYDFSFVKTQGQTNPQGQTSPQGQAQPTPGPTPGVTDVPPTYPPTDSAPLQDPGAPSTPPSYEPSPVINVPAPPDFTGTANGSAAGQNQNNVPLQPPVDPGPDYTPAGQPVQPQQPVVNNQNPPEPVKQPVKTPANQNGAQTATAGDQGTFKFLAHGPKPRRYKLSDNGITHSLDKVINGENVVDTDWLQILNGVKKYHKEAGANALSAPVIDDEFERINSVLLTYIYGGTFGRYDAAIMMYRNQYFAFLGPLSKDLRELSLKNYNSEESYKLLRLLGGDIIKIISDRLFMFSIKPLSFCVNEIMREVSNGEFYKVEVLFRVMTSSEAPVQNLVRPFFHLLKSKIQSAYETEKNAGVRNNFARAFEMLSKIK